MGIKKTQNLTLISNPLEKLGEELLKKVMGLRTSAHCTVY
jgi:hypothetical protein